MAVCGLRSLMSSSRCARSLSSSCPWLPLRWCSSDAERRPWLDKVRERLCTYYTAREYYKPLPLRQIENLHLSDIFVDPLLTDKPRDLETEAQYGKEGDKLSPYLPIDNNARARAKHYKIHGVFQDLESGAERGKTVLILGSSGTGKTTCFGRMLLYRWAKLDCLLEVKLLLLVRIRTHRNPGRGKEPTLRHLFRLDNFGLKEEEIQNILDFLTKRDDPHPNDVCIIVDGLDKCKLEHKDLLHKIIERRSNIHAYNLLITARPCHQVDDFHREGCFHRELYLYGFSRPGRDLFLKNYVFVRHKKEWAKVREDYANILDVVDNYCDLLTRLPFTTTLLGELLPTLKPAWAPNSRTELFNKLIGYIIARDLKAEETGSVGDVNYLSDAHQKALRVMGELALDDLLSSSPNSGFSAKDLRTKLKNSGNLNAEDSVTQVRNALTMTISRFDSFREEDFFLFLDSSVQEYLAAYAFSSESETKEIPHGLTADRLEAFWLFSAGHSCNKAGLAAVFKKMMACHGGLFKAPGVSETVMTMLEEAFPCVNEDVQSNHAVLLRDVSNFLKGHLYYGRRWAIQKRPFRCVGHAMQVLPGIEKVTVFSRSLPERTAFAYFVKGLKCQRESLTKIKLLSGHTKDTSSIKPEEIAIAHAKELASFLRETTCLEVFRSDWQLPDDSIQLLCLEGIAKCKKLWDVGLSLHSGTVSEKTMKVFSSVVQRHRSLRSVNVTDIGPQLPKPLADLITNKQCKVERLNILMNNASREMICSLLTALQLNKSLTAIGLITSNYFFENKHIDRSDRHQHHVVELARTIRKHPMIYRVIIETATFSLDDSCFLAMFKELTCADAATKTPIKFLKVVCNQDISEDAGRQFEQLVKRSKLKVVSTRWQLDKPYEPHEAKEQFKATIPAFYPRGHPLHDGQKPEKWWWALAVRAFTVALLAVIAFTFALRLNWLRSHAHEKRRQESTSTPWEETDENFSHSPSGNASLETDLNSPESKIVHQEKADPGSSVSEPPTSVTKLLLWLVSGVVSIVGFLKPMVFSEKVKHQGAEGTSGQRCDNDAIASPTVDRSVMETELSDEPRNQRQSPHDVHVGVGSGLLTNAKHMVAPHQESQRVQEPSPQTDEGMCLNTDCEKEGSAGATHPDKTPALELLSSPEQVASPELYALPPGSLPHNEFGRGESPCTPETSDSSHKTPQEPSLPTQSPSPRQLQSLRPVSVRPKPISLNNDDHRILFGAKAECEEVVYPAALCSPLLPALRPQLEFFIYELDLKAILDELIGRNVLSPSRDIYQEIVKEGLSLNKRRRLLFFYILGSLPFSAFEAFWRAIEVVHGVHHRDTLSSLEEAMVKECRTFIIKHCLSLHVESAGRVLNRLSVQTPQSFPFVQLSFLMWHEDNTNAISFPHLLQVMVDEGVYEHPSTPVISRSSSYTNLPY